MACSMPLCIEKLYYAANYDDICVHYAGDSIEWFDILSIMYTDAVLTTEGIPSVVRTAGTKKKYPMLKNHVIYFSEFFFLCVCVCVCVCGFASFSLPHARSGN